MKRHISVLICALVVVSLVLALASCNGKTHTYSDKWSYDETNHWHAATCEDGDDCKEAKASVAAHTDANNDKVCDVCAYDYNHEHTYATEYTSDKDAHWYAASCGCTVEGSGKGAHVDANNDGACDTCAYNGGHEHEIDANAWASDDTNHWHPVNCGHSVAEKEEHDYNDVDVCDTCGYVKGGMTVEKAVELGDYYSDLVNGAIVNYKSGIDSYIASEIIMYELGNASSKITVGGDEYSVDYWYTLLESGSILGVIEYPDGSVDKPYFPASGLVDGYAFENFFGYEDEDSENIYGANAIIPTLYAMSENKNVVNFEAHTVTVDGKTAYAFVFDRIFPYEEYDYETEETAYLAYIWSVEVVFTLSANNTYEAIAVISEKYNAEAVTEIDDADEVTVKGYNKIGLAPTIVYNYEVVQTVGDRTLDFKYNPEKVLLKDFELYTILGTEDVYDDAGDLIGTNNILSSDPIEESFTMAAGTSIDLAFGSMAPATALPAINNIDVVSDGLYVQLWDGEIMVGASGAGEYTFTVTTDLTEKTYTVTVEEAPVTEIYPTVNDEEVSVYNVYSVDGQPVSITFSAGVNPYANGAYTAKAPAGTQLVDNGNGTYTVTITPDRGGNANIVVMLMSTVNPDVTAMLEIFVTPAPTPDVILNGTWFAEIDDYTIYEYGTTSVTAIFTPESEGATSGTVTVTASAMGGYITKNDVLTYVYDAETGEITLTDSDEKESLGYSFTISDSYKIALTFSMGTVDMERPDTSFAGQIKDTEWRSEQVFNAKWGEVPMYLLCFGEDGEGYLSDHEGNVYPDYEWSVDNETGVITITFINDYDGEIANATFTYNAEEKTITAVYGETTIVFVENVW